MYGLLDLHFSRQHAAMYLVLGSSLRYVEHLYTALVQPWFRKGTSGTACVLRPCYESPTRVTW